MLLQVFKLESFSDFKPNFARFPIDAFMSGTLSGNRTVICRPEGAPYPTIEWLKNGRNLNLVADDNMSRVRMLANGNLVLSQLQLQDQGEYTCKATNDLGSATSTGTLTISGRILLFLVVLV